MRCLPWLALGFIVIDLGFYPNSCRSFGAEPPNPIPIGQDVWDATGNLPDEVSLSADENGREVIVSAPSGHPVRFSIRPSAADKRRQELWLHFGDRLPIENSQYSRAGFGFDVGTGDIIPVYNDLYAVTVIADTVHLTRVTDKVSDEDRPSGKGRAVSLVDVWPRIFYEKTGKSRDEREFDRINISLDPKGGIANVQLQPALSTRRSTATASRKPAQLDLKVGDSVCRGGRCYRVNAIVPEKEIAGIGRLVGWVEFSRLPIEPTVK
jgi:hypothetical protein